MRRTVRLEPWSEDDPGLLRLHNSPEMTAHLGGPESEERLTARHRRCLELERGGMYRVVLAAGGRAVGAIGFWERQRPGGVVWETGWGISPAFQGRGLAARAARAVVAEARAAGRHRRLHAYPGVGHAASNGVCRAAGFTLLGPVDFEYPKGHWSTSHDWWIDLASL